ncbi:MAG: hypothetical protein RQ866_05415 [Bacteroidales bacterium]|nr:hypothetical protein [Bacteroidales bacterium]
MDNYHIRRCTGRDRRLGKEIAGMHKSLISEGFLSSLPMPFLTLLYKYLIKRHIVFIAVTGKDRVLGFVAATLHPEKLMRDFVFRNNLRILFTLAPVLFRRRVLRQLRETKKTTSIDDATEANMPELLSIAVMHDAGNRGVGAALLKCLESALRAVKVKKYKVVAGEKLSQANNFYVKHNFKNIDEKVIHNNEISIVYCKKLFDGEENK